MDERRNETNGWMDEDFRIPATREMFRRYQGKEKDRRSDRRRFHTLRSTSLLLLIAFFVSFSFSFVVLSIRSFRRNESKIEKGGKGLDTGGKVRIPAGGGTEQHSSLCFSLSFLNSSFLFSFSFCLLFFIS